jgi:hypothetical protein
MFSAMDYIFMYVKSHYCCFFVTFCTVLAGDGVEPLDS